MRLLAIALCALMTACAGPASTPAPVGLWRAIATGPFALVQMAPDRVAFDFPRGDPPTHHVSYVTRPVGALNARLEATYAIDVTGSPVFDYHTAAKNTCDAPATARLFFARRGWSDDGALSHQYQRWWAIDGAQALHAGQGYVGADLAPSNWTSVYGVRGDASPEATTAFNEARANVGEAGLTFGGGCFYGHGVAVSGGAARFTLTEFVAQ